MGIGGGLRVVPTCWLPSGREVPPAESVPRRGKVLLPKFGLEMVALRPESPLLIFSRSK